MRGTLVAAVAAVAVVAAPTATAAAAPASPGWSVVVTPRPAGAAATALAGVACSGASACTAVGESQRHGGVFPLAERWNGTAFSIQPTPSPGGPSAPSMLSGVSCPAASACTAVGSFATSAFNVFTLAERWNGTAWSIQRTPNRPNAAGVTVNRLAGVSCPAASACTAVGSYQNGDQTFPLAERWNGTTWSLQPIPSPPGAFTSRLTAVSCSAATACTAVGTSNGHGEDLPLAERWNGTTWTIQPVPSPTDEGGKLFGVSCSAATACTAVGQFLDHAAAQTFALAERWNGTAWTIQNSPPPPSAADAFLHAVSCPAATACTAAGDFFGQTSADLTLAQHWDGTAWSVQPTPNPGRLANQLSAVACPAPASCLAVGTQFKGQGQSFALAERFTG
jgi:hypothetical protein